MELDAIDHKILKELQEDARLTNVELASRVNLSPSPCLARVKAMERAGIIRRRVTLLDPAALGLNISVFIHVSLENQRREGLDEFERAVSALSSVMECPDDWRRRLSLTGTRARHAGTGAAHCRRAYKDS